MEKFEKIIKGSLIFVYVGHLVLDFYVSGEFGIFSLFDPLFNPIL